MWKHLLVACSLALFVGGCAEKKEAETKVEKTTTESGPEGTTTTKETTTHETEVKTDKDKAP